MAAAHEVFPSIMNLSAADGAISIDIELNAEAMLAGVDLSTVTDTNDAENGADYDGLRSLSPQEIKALQKSLASKVLILTILVTL